MEYTIPGDIYTATGSTAVEVAGVEALEAFLEMLEEFREEV